MKEGEAVVHFPFNMIGLVFQDGIEGIRKSYDTAVEALSAEVELKKEAAIQYQDHIDQGGDPMGEWEDGHALWTQDQVLELEIEMAEERVQTLRKAFAVILYHHWERTAQIVGGKAKGDHAQLVKYMLADEYPIDPHLGAVRDLANLIKHNSTACGIALLQSAPQLLTVTQPPNHGHAWGSAIRLTDNHMVWLFDTVAHSGPTMSMVPPN